jgi:hypothetical protein
MTIALRRFVFTTHVTSSVGWVGAVLVFLALSLIGLTSPNEATARGAYLVMAPAAWFVLVPLAHASLLTGVAISLTRAAPAARRDGIGYLQAIWDDDLRRVLQPMNAVRRSAPRVRYDFGPMTVTVLLLAGSGHPPT